MCGIAGFIGHPDKELLQRMKESIRHRGPDQEGVFISQECSFAHQRLSIIDLSEKGRQPMSTKDGRFTVVFNGEIYNYKELRQKYSAMGWVFQTQTDTECLLASASLCSFTDISDFHGMFSFAVWDVKEQTCYFARDRMGIKPLFIAELNGRFFFASEISAILECGSSWTICSGSREMYFRLGYVPGPKTIVSGIDSLAPGVLYAYQDKKITFKDSFRKQKIVSVSHNEEEVKKELLKELDETISRQLVSDREVGCFLSGGVDSSAVLSSVRIAKPGVRIKTFTTRFAHKTLDQKFNQDADYAKKTAQKYDCEHHEIEIFPEDIVSEGERIAYHLGQPNGNHSVIALNAISRAASKLVPVVLGGDGGDEIFGGYERYRLYARIAPFFNIPFFRQLAMGSIFWHPKFDNWKDFLQSKTEEGRFFSMHAISSRVYEKMFTFNTTATLMERWFSDIQALYENSLDPVKRFMAFDRYVWLLEDSFVRSDRLTMRYGLEMRVPLIDDKLISFSNALPRKWLVDAKDTKILWRSAVADRCLPEVIQGKKRGWFPPTAKWIRDELREWTWSILEEAIQDHEWIKGDAVREMYHLHMDKKGYYLNEIWNIIGYQLWWRGYKKYFV